MSPQCCPHTGAQRGQGLSGGWRLPGLLSLSLLDLFQGVERKEWALQAPASPSVTWGTVDPRGSCRSLGRAGALAGLRNPLPSPSGAQGPAPCGWFPELLLQAESGGGGGGVTSTDPRPGPPPLPAAQTPSKQGAISPRSLWPRGAMALRSLLEAAPPKASGSCSEPGNKLGDGACAPAPGAGRRSPRTALRAWPCRGRGWACCLALGPPPTPVQSLRPQPAAPVSPPPGRRPLRSRGGSGAGGGQG